MTTQGGSEPTGFSVADFVEADSDRCEYVRLCRNLFAAEGDEVTFEKALRALKEHHTGNGWLDVPKPVALQLTERAEKAEAELAQLRQTLTDLGTVCSARQSRALVAEARVKALEEALRPFAEAATWTKAWGDHLELPGYVARGSSSRAKEVLGG